MAGRPRIRRRGGQPRSRDGSCPPFWRLFIPFALHRRLPADSRRRLPARGPSRRAAMPRDGGDGPHRDRRAVHPDLQDVRPHERVGVLRTPRDVAGLHHLFDAGFERYPDHDPHDPRRARLLVCERGGRRHCPVLIVDGSGGGLRPARGIHRDDPAVQRADALWIRHRDDDRPLATPDRRDDPGRDRIRNRVRDFSDLASMGELSLPRQLDQQWLCVLGSRGLWLVRQDLQPALSVRRDDAGKSLRQRAVLRSDLDRPRWDARRSRRSSLPDVSVCGGGFRHRRNRRRAFARHLESSGA